MSLPLTLIVDATVLGAPRSGIGVYTERVLAHLDPQRVRVVPRGAPRNDASPATRSFIRGIPGAYAARRALSGWPPLRSDAVFFGPNFLLPPWPLVRDHGVITVHDLLFFEHPEWADARRGAMLRAALGSSVARAQAIVVTTERTRRALDARYRCGDKTHVIALGIRRFTLPGKTPGQTPILVIGNIEPRKDPLVVLRAHRRLPRALRERHPLWFIGAALDARYAQTLHGALDAHAVWRERLTDDALAQALADAALVVAPSRAEGYGLVPLEALGAGVSVVASDLPVVRELCGDMVTYFTPGDDTELARVLASALATPRTVDATVLLHKHDWREVSRRHEALFLGLR